MLAGDTGKMTNRPHFAHVHRITRHFHLPAWSKIVSVRALQKTFAWNFSSNLPRNFALKNGEGLRFPRKKARKLLKKLGENSEQNSGQNSGRKFTKFGELSFRNVSDQRDMTSYAGLTTQETQAQSGRSDVLQTIFPCYMKSSAESLECLSDTGPQCVTEKYVTLTGSVILYKQDMHPLTQNYYTLKTLNSLIKEIEVGLLD